MKRKRRDPSPLPSNDGEPVENLKCDICLQEELFTTNDDDSDSNALLKCALCGIIVHQACYEPEDPLAGLRDDLGSFHCDYCCSVRSTLPGIDTASGSYGHECVMCNTRIVSPMKLFEDESWVHLTCRRYCKPNQLITEGSSHSCIVCHSDPSIKGLLSSYGRYFHACCVLSRSFREFIDLSVESAITLNHRYLMWEESLFQFNLFFLNGNFNELCRFSEFYKYLHPDIDIVRLPSVSDLFSLCQSLFSSRHDAKLIVVDISRISKSISNQALQFKYKDSNNRIIGTCNFRSMFLGLSSLPRVIVLPFADNCVESFSHVELKERIHDIMLNGDGNKKSRSKQKSNSSEMKIESYVPPLQDQRSFKMIFNSTTPRHQEFMRLLCKSVHDSKSDEVELGEMLVLCKKKLLCLNRQAMISNLMKEFMVCNLCDDNMSGS